MKLVIAITLFALWETTCLVQTNRAENELLTLNFVFRHGDRTPKGSYKKDPYRTYQWPEGMAALTAHGKERMYEYGKLLRKRYANFIDHTLARNVQAHSSPAKRCLETTQVVLAGLFPPKQAEVWSHNKTSGDELAHLWNPIAVETTNQENDFLLSPSPICYNATMIELKMFADPKVQKFLHDNQEFLEQLSHHSGMHFSTPLDAVKLFDTITCERFYFGDKFVQPKWLDEMGNNTLARIEKLTNEAMKLVYGVSDTYLRLRAGMFITDLLQNLNHAASETNMDERNRRVTLYGTHDSVIATFLLAFGFFKEPPSFGSGLIIELRKDSQGVPQVHLFYANVTTAITSSISPVDIYQLKLNESSTFNKLCHSAHCALKHFETSLHKFVPEDIKKECEYKSHQ